MSDDLGGVVLCGGRSKRMGYAKALLPFGDELLLQRVVRRLSDSVSQVAVVHAAGQSLPELPTGVVHVVDDEPDLGPLQGIACGLRALMDRCEFAFVMSCDTPFMTGSLIQRLNELRGEKSIAISVEDEMLHPLCAIYATSLWEIAMEQLSQGARRPIALLDHATSERIPVESLRSVDPELASLMNVNDPMSYVVALKRAGLEISEEMTAKLGIGEEPQKPR